MAGHTSTEQVENVLFGSEEYSGMLGDNKTDTYDCKDKAFHALKTMRNDDVLCDVTLLVGLDKVAVRAHRALLSAFSEYFRRMFTGGLKESTQNEVHLPCVDPESFQLILDCVYDGYVELSTETVHRMTLLANFFGCESLLNHCISFIRGNIQNETCVAVLNFAVKYDLEKLKESAMNYVIEHLEEVYKINLDFAQLSVDLVLELTENPATVIHGDPAENEEQLFMKLWNRLGSLPRPQHTEWFPKILKAIHLPIVKPDFLAHIEKKMGHIEEAMKLIEEAKKEVDILERREWYLPRYKSEVMITVTNNATPIIVDGTEFNYYSNCVLIKGFPWFLYGSKIIKNNRMNRVFYKIHLDSPVAIEDLNLPYKVVGKCGLGITTYHQGQAEKKPTEKCSLTTIVEVNFEDEVF